VDTLVEKVKMLLIRQLVYLQMCLCYTHDDPSIPFSSIGMSLLSRRASKKHTHFPQIEQDERLQAFVRSE
jgi:hypothetical protein